MHGKTSRKHPLIKWLLVLLIGLPVVHYAGRVFVVDRFGISGVSMAPTLTAGQKVWVNKLLMGPRIYTKFDFSGGDLKCVRLPGMRKLRVGDVAVFNCPYGQEGDSIAFRINYVYCKRCWGVPGDTVLIVDGRLVGSWNIQNRFWHEHRADELVDILASIVPEKVSVRAGNFAGEEERWTLRDFGPIVVPKRGMTVALDSTVLRRYGQVIDWERRCAGSASEEVAGSTYTFRQDWYFFVGDNFLNSWDSRHFGFVPADFVVGIVPNK
ncbi:signal peptidase I [Bacteroidales bacterium WCE2004]|nr:signal peptidase I [Bacteroidales bacterium WCE2004]